jgi:Phosphodiester glycosidase
MMSRSVAPSVPTPWCVRSEHRVRLADGAATTLHVAGYHRATTRVRVAAMERPMRLIDWCRIEGVSDAVVGGFFVRQGGMALGELWISGRKLPSTPFDPPWDARRACLQIDGGDLRIAPRSDLGSVPGGDLLQAGPLLLEDGRAVRGDGEGFSAGAAQFDSDITGGRFPRAALAVTGPRLLAVACDGRSELDAGLTLGELADVLRELGANTAINLDGGGSTTLVNAFALRNRPREEHGIALAGGRPIATALAFTPA